MQNSITKPAIASNATAASTNVIAELNCARALSALCGGSGVGQAPEPPQRAALRQAQGKTLRLASLAQGKIREAGEFLPKAPQSLQDTKEKLKAKSEKISYEMGERQESEQERKIYELTNKRINELREKEIKEIRGVVRIREIKGKLKEFIGKPRQVFRLALQTASYACILVALAGFCFAYGSVIKAEAGYQWKQLVSQGKQVDKGEKGNVVEKVEKKTETVEELPKTNAEEFVGINFPADTSIVIPKIDAAAEIVPNVDPSNYEEYMAALQKGVAHAKGTALPGMVGNSYLFAHSAGNLFDIARFNAVFYLIGKLEKGDPIYVKFGNEKFKYTVIDKKEVDPNDVQFLTGNLGKIESGGGIEGIEAGDRTLTLQTCVPPGTDWRRLLVFAKIED